MATERFPTSRRASMVMIAQMSPAVTLGFPQPANVPGVQMTRWTLSSGVAAACFSRDGCHSAFGLADGSIRIVPLNRFATRKMIATTLHHSAVRSIRPDCTSSRFLCAGDDGRVIHVSSDGFGAELADYGDGPAPRIDTHPNVGRAVGRGTEIELFDRNGASAGRLNDHPEPISDLAFSPDGIHLAAAHGGGVTLWSLSGDGYAARRFNAHGDHRSLAWSPDSSRLAAVAGRSARCWRVSDGDKMIVDGCPTAPAGIAFTANGNYLAASSGDGVLCWSMQRRGAQAAWPKGVGVMSGCRATQSASHPRHTLIAAGYADGCVLLADICGDREIVVRHADGGAVSALAWSPDGDYLAAGGAGGVAAIFDFTRLTRVARQ